MTSAAVVSSSLGPSIVNLPAGVGSRVVQPGAAFGKLRLPTDPIGAFALTLTGVVVGSRIHVETQAGAAVTDRVATGSTEVFSLSAYTAGSANNDLRVKVRKASSSPYYRPWDTLVTAVVGAQSIYVSQIADE